MGPAYIGLWGHREGSLVPDTEILGEDREELDTDIPVASVPQAGVLLWAFPAMWTLSLLLLRG